MNLDVLMNLDMKLMLHVYEMRWQIYHLHALGIQASLWCLVFRMTFGNHF